MVFIHIYLKASFFQICKIFLKKSLPNITLVNNGSRAHSNDLSNKIHIHPCTFFSAFSMNIEKIMKTILDCQVYEYQFFIGLINLCTSF